MGTQEPRRLAQGQTAEVDDDGQGARSTADGFALIEGADTVSAASIAIADERLPAKGPHTNWRSLSRFRHAASEGPGMGADLFALGEAVDGAFSDRSKNRTALLTAMKTRSRSSRAARACSATAAGCALLSQEPPKTTPRNATVESRPVRESGFRAHARWVSNRGPSLRSADRSVLANGLANCPSTQRAR